jgi:DNA-directed RNA polymerase specialized sigma subunit
MLTIPERFTQIDEQVGQAMAAVESDTGASPVLHAVVKEFRRKSLKALEALEDGDNQAVVVHIIEVEQAADSAKYAAEADEGLTAKARKAVLDAHFSTCILKSELSLLVE